MPSSIINHQSSISYPPITFLTTHLIAACSSFRSSIDNTACSSFSKSGSRLHSWYAILMQTALTATARRILQILSRVKLSRSTSISFTSGRSIREMLSHRRSSPSSPRFANIFSTISRRYGRSILLSFLHNTSITHTACHAKRGSSPHVISQSVEISVPPVRMSPTIASTLLLCNGLTDNIDMMSIYKLPKLFCNVNITSKKHFHLFF